MKIELFGRLPKLCAFKIGVAEYCKISDTHALNAQGKQIPFQPRVLVETALVNAVVSWGDAVAA